MTAAHATLVSLLNTTDQIHNHPLVSTFFAEHLIQSLREKVEFFLDFVEKYSDACATEMEDLVGEIAFVAHVAEDMIERHVADQIRAASTEKNPNLIGDLQKIIQEMDSIKQKIFKFEEEKGFKDVQPAYLKHAPPSSSTHLATSKTTMLGFDGYLEQLLDQLTGYNSGRQILPIVGMGGIGKTTLARNVYESLHAVHHFDIRVWVTVSQEFRARELVLQALSCLRENTNEMDIKNDDELGEELYKTLWGRRYLVVLDDVWSVEAWEKIMNLFPETNNGSRIVITTRQPEVVLYFGSSATALDFLDDKNSWLLFCDKAFAQQGCPYPELEHVGKKIVKKCKGLPLAIVVIGGLLAKSSRTQEYWEEIASDLSLILNSGDGNQVLSILSLSYKHMPLQLRSCFLYLGLFPEDHQIDVSQLIKVWVAEGFIKPNADQSLEETAECCMKELMDRKLLLVGEVRWNKKIKSCCVHDLVRDMCIRIAEKENFFCVERGIYGRFHESPHVDHLFVDETSLLMRVLSGFLTDSFREVNLRIKHHRCRPPIMPLPHFLPSSISQLWSLQTLMIYGTLRHYIAPYQIWEMLHLRHIDINILFGVRLHDPSPSGEHDHVVMRNLQTLKKVSNLIFSDEVCKRIPNIKELHIEYDYVGVGEGVSYSYHLQNIGGFNKLESLHYRGNKYWGDRGSLRNLKLPNSLKQLTLVYSCIAWSDVALVGSLPNLEILELDRNEVIGAEWNSDEELFRCLKHLRIQEFSNTVCDQIHWIANNSSLPVLETLSLRHLSKLDEIPSCFGEITTLERMEMSNCSESANNSALQILQKQQSLGNESLQLHLEFKTKNEMIALKTKVQQLEFTCQNFQTSFIFNG